MFQSSFLQKHKEVFTDQSKRQFLLLFIKRNDSKHSRTRTKSKRPDAYINNDIIVYKDDIEFKTQNKQKDRKRETRKTDFPKEKVKKCRLT